MANTQLSDTWLYWYRDKEARVDPSVSRVASLFKKKGVSKILDLGCGTGRHSIYLAKRGFQVSAFDQSRKAIRRANELSRDVLINFKTWNMINFPYPYANSTFDAIVCTKVLHHTTKNNIQRIASEISRVTTERAYLFVEVPTTQKLKRFENDQETKMEEVEKGSIKFLNGVERGVVHHYFTKKELMQLFSDFSPLKLDVRKEHYLLLAIKRQKR
ncbi:MAG: class I SAM-dependent methyltransferase [Nitrososphaerales archaeon]